MVDRILRLYPGPPQETALAGTYLAHDLHRQGSAAAPFVYASFVCSLDGRIAFETPGTGSMPAGLISGSDFRLLLELLAQADCVITHGGYVRAVAAGRLDDILQVGLQDETRDLAAWRRDNGLPPQPAVAIASASLDLPIPESLARHGQRVLIATGEAAPRDRIEALRACGHEVILAGRGRSVEGGPLTRALGRLGFRSLYMLTGPRMLETMLRDGALSRLYLTIVHRILGGEAFYSLISGPELGPAGRLRMCSLHYDPAGPDEAGQWFAEFEPMRPPGEPKGDRLTDDA